MTTALTIQTIDAEARVLDTDLASSLGMADPRKVRQHIILANQIELEGFGTLLTRRVTTGGRPANTYYLNEEQALLVCMLARTPKAPRRREELETFGPFHAASEKVGLALETFGPCIHRVRAHPTDREAGAEMARKAGGGY